MSGFCYDGVRRSPSHKWTLEQKVTLCVLIDVYGVPWLGAKAIFNALFSDELASPQGLKRGALFSMRHQIRKDGWSYTGRWTSIRTSIEAKAFELGINLRPKALPEATKTMNATKLSKAPNHEHRSSSPTFQSKRQLIDDVDSAAESSDTLIGEDEEELQQPCTGHGHSPVTRIPTRSGPMSSSSRTLLTDQGARTSKGIPRLAYRGYCDQSQGINTLTHFRAGLFVNTANVPECPDPRSEYYRKEAARHVRRLHTGFTPFISVSVSLLRVCKIALRMGANSKIAIIDLHKAIGSRKYAKYNAVESMNLQQYTRENYTGQGEWLIWGSTSAVIGTASISDIHSLSANPGYNDPFSFETILRSRTAFHARLQFSKNHVPCSFSMGSAIANLVKVFRLPREMLFEFVDCVVKDWKLEHQGSWDENPDFMSGIDSGLGRDLTGSFALKINSWNSFVESLHNFLRPANSSSGSGYAITAPFNAADLGRSESPAKQRDPWREIAPSSSGSSGGYKRIKQEQEVGELYLSDRCVTQSGNTGADRPSSAFQGREWRRVEGYGPCFSVYESRGC